MMDTNLDTGSHETCWDEDAFDEPARNWEE